MRNRVAWICIRKLGVSFRVANRSLQAEKELFSWIIMSGGSQELYSPIAHLSQKQVQLMLGLYTITIQSSGKDLSGGHHFGMLEHVDLIRIYERYKTAAAVSLLPLSQKNLVEHNTQHDITSSGLQTSSQLSEPWGRQGTP